MECATCYSIDCYRSMCDACPTRTLKLLSTTFISGQYGIAMNWNFVFKRDYWRSSKVRERTHSITPKNSREIRQVQELSTVNPEGAAIVSVDHLVKKFGPDKIAVNDVSFNLYSNQITSLLGPSGSGKTTIFNCLIGIHQQTSGTIKIQSDNNNEYDTNNQMATLRQSIGYCPQHDILFDLLTVEEQLEFYATARGFGASRKQIVQEMLERVNLQSSKAAYCSSLSGGMKRRLSLACAFVGDTKIVLLDEVSTTRFVLLTFDFLRLFDEFF
jgi:ABC-type lipoprotein export system ATPase subunit